MSTSAIHPLPENDSFDLADFISFLWLKKWRIIITTILLTSVGVMYVKNQPKIYSATSTILLDEKIKYHSFGGFDTYAGKTGERLDTFIEFMRSRQFTQIVVERLKLQESPEFKRLLPDGRRVTDLQTANSVFVKNLKISKISNTEMLKVTFESQVAHIAAEVANQIGPIFFRYKGQIRKYKASETTRWLDGQLKVLKEELDTAETALETFLAENGLINLDNQVELTKTEIEKLIDHKLLMDKNLAIEQSYIQQITEAGDDIDKLLKIPVVANDPLLRSIAANLFAKKLAFEEISKRYKYKHHKHIAATGAVKTIQENFDQSLSQVLEGIKQNYRSTQIRQKALAKQLSDMRVKHLELSEHDIELATLERNVEAKLKLYEVFVSRLQEMEIQKDLDEEGEFAIVDYAQIPEYPTKPKVLLGAVFSLVLSFIFSVGFWLFVHLIADKKSRFKQVLKRTGVPLLGEIPKPPKKANTSSVSKSRPSKAALLYSETIRSLRAEMMVRASGASLKTIAVTHVVAGKQARQTSVDLAESYAQIEKTLLIDGNLRDPKIGSLYGLESLSAGLTSFLSGRSAFSGSKYQEVGSQLVVMPSGPVPSDPLMYFTKPRFSAIIKKLKTLYPYTIIETPAVNEANDILVVAKTVDAVVLLCDVEVAESNDLLEAIQRLLNAGVPLLGVVFERAKNVKSQVAKSNRKINKVAKVLN